MTCKCFKAAGFPATGDHTLRQSFTSHFLKNGRPAPGGPGSSRPRRIGDDESLRAPGFQCPGDCRTPEITWGNPQTPANRKTQATVRYGKNKRSSLHSGFSIIIVWRTYERETINLGNHTLTLMGIIGVTALVLNIPLGYLREGQRKYSLAWFVYIHLSIPLIAYLRIANHVTSWLIPFFILCALAGQIVGGKARRQTEKGR